ncbi:hypothetical protein LO771_08105 [Streptacidiphilus sp. ASG 303]|uniref:tRNA adenosine deaminase-associated protein n=1 Tax=Streptacidiphilus sp. ASG 303 TaxID=2896847 RepID=UPI001E650B69|nr:hypothetical protein [Streptacidiphilus sp. ASG 303]MCD0482370.1 hypothetical protein [Streptacidiphilus sp. ASG 303]
MAYFAAVLARTEDGWSVGETELDNVETLADLADLARQASDDEEPVLVFIEQEDAWFAVVRVDGEEDPRIFVSDGAAAARSAYGEIVLTDELVGRSPGDGLDDLDTLVAELDDEDGAAGSASEDDDDSGTAADPDGVPAGPLGDTEVLAEFGITARELLAMSGEGAVPGDALAEIADSLGCAEVLEAVR